MGTYRIRPYIVRAFQWQVDPTPDWFKEALNNSYAFIINTRVERYTLESVETAYPGDYITDKLHFYTPHEFHQKYELDR
jgi:hypothetical protein